MPLSRSREPAASAPARVCEFFAEHGAFVTRSLRALGVAETDLDDTVQEVFLVVHERLKNYDKRRQAIAWLYSTCRRISAAQRRAVGGQPKTDTSNVFDSSAVPKHLEQVEDREAWTLVHRLLEQLPAPERKVFLLYELEDFPMRKVAQELGCPIQTAYSRLYRARSQILAEVEHIAIAK